MENPPTPALKRRLAVMVYESLLLFGPLFGTSLVFDVLTNSKHALFLRDSRQAVLFVMLGFYFVYCWHRSGQTLPMKTWRIRLVMPGMPRVPLLRATGRFLLAWGWFLPALALDYALGLKGWASLALIALNMVLWAATVRLDKDRQFLHDKLMGTRLVEYETPPPPPKKVKWRQT